MFETEPLTFKVIDLKQYVYCPRIFYYHTVLPRIRPITYKMEAGIAAHDEAEEKEKRRNLRSYGLREGTRHFNVRLYDRELGLSGEIDMLIETKDELIPIDYKAATRKGEHFEVQLMAYGRLLESTWPDSSKSVKRGFLYLIPRRKAIEIPFTRGLRRQLTSALKTMQTIAKSQQMPKATRQRRRCVECEFRRFCNDVL